MLLPASAIDYQTLFGQQEDGSYYDLSVVSYIFEWHEHREIYPLVSCSMLLPNAEFQWKLLEEDYKFDNVSQNIML